MKKYDIVAVTGEYTNKQGETKKQYKNVGAVMTNQNGGFYIMLDRTFNPAGLPNPENRSSCVLSMFEPKSDGSTSQSQQGRRQQPVNDFDSDIPF